jgi:hypothetical protein
MICKVWHSRYRPAGQPARDRPPGIDAAAFFTGLGAITRHPADRATTDDD